jgi:hypothetical protein
MGHPSLFCIVVPDSLCPRNSPLSNVLDVFNQPFHITGLALHSLFSNQNTFLRIAVKPATHYGGKLAGGAGKPNAKTAINERIPERSVIRSKLIDTHNHEGIF